MREKKYIITKNRKHFTSEWLHHETIARDNKVLPCDVVECGVILDGKVFILECTNTEHLHKRSNKYIGNRLNEYQDTRLKKYLESRQLESMYYYSKEAIKELPEGD